jgi:hypothetical protein
MPGQKDTESTTDVVYGNLKPCTFIGVISDFVIRLRLGRKRS